MNPDRLLSTISTLNKINEKLLVLSTDVSPEHTSSLALIKDLLRDVQEVNRSIQEHLTTHGSTDSVSSEFLKENKRLKVLLDVTREVHSTLESDTIAANILDSILRFSGAERGLILIQDPTTGEHLVRVGRILTENEFRSGDVVVPRTVIGRVLKDRRPVYSTSIQDDNSLMAVASIRDLEIRSLACLPLLVDDEIPGIIYFDFKTAQVKLGPGEREVLDNICSQAAIALANANRFRLARRRAHPLGQSGMGKLIGTSPQMQEVFMLIGQVAMTPTTSVLITGASGTGKELVARAIHDLSVRKEEPFVAVNCAALPPNLLESELFGHEKGAFTDARTRKLGLIEQANGGTLMLDEIGEMTPGLQAKLLRVLEERIIRRLGGVKDIRVDIRVIAATNIDIEKSVKTGAFREDLYYRLNVFPVSLPPLRDRGDDVVLIANALVEDLNVRLGTEFDRIDPHGNLAKALKMYDWPGNVRELRNVLERAMILGSGRNLNIRDFPSPINSSLPQQSDVIIPPDNVQIVTPDSMKQLSDVENEYIDRVLSTVNNNRKRASEILGIDLSTLYRKLNRRKV